MFLVPLDSDQMEQNLGAGYDIGYWSWSDMVSRPDQCVFNREELQRQRQRRDQMTQRRHSSLEDLSLHMTSTGYHAGKVANIKLALRLSVLTKPIGGGHVGVGNCNAGSSPLNGPMHYAECSGRD